MSSEGLRRSPSDAKEYRLYHKQPELLPMAPLALEDPDRITPVIGKDPLATTFTLTSNISLPTLGATSSTESQAGSRGGTNFPPGSCDGFYLTNRTKYFRSTRIKKGEIAKPWLDKRDPREKWVNIIPIIGVLVGLAVSSLLIWGGIRSVTNNRYCEVLKEDWSSWNDEVWTKEVEAGGYGNGQFEETTNTNENVYIQDGVLVIQPTLQDNRLLEINNTIDLREKGCTGSKWTDCIMTTNITNGTIVNPVKSGRVNTKRGATIRFGRVEVLAKLPVGDWLWPAIWMLPSNNTYGDWPRSGEIDIMESRGNNYTYSQGGNNVVSSTLHFGPDPANDSWWRNNVKRTALHDTYASKWHTYGLQWTEKYLFTYVDSRLLQVSYTRFDETFWHNGKFPLTESNGTRLQDPWGHTGRLATPFDQDFYLILNVAVGGTNGWFRDGDSGKPWLNRNDGAKSDFWRAKEDWYPTWRKQGFMQVKSVKMWQQAGYNGCIA